MLYLPIYRAMFPTDCKCSNCKDSTLRIYDGCVNAPPQDTKIRIWCKQLMTLVVEANFNENKDGIELGTVASHPIECEEFKAII